MGDKQIINTIAGDESNFSALNYESVEPAN